MTAGEVAGAPVAQGRLRLVVLLAYLVLLGLVGVHYNEGEREGGMLQGQV